MTFRSHFGSRLSTKFTSVPCSAPRTGCSPRMATSTPAWWPLEAMEAASEATLVASGRLSMAAAAMTQLCLNAEELAAKGAAAVECSIDVFKKVQAFERGAVVVAPETAYPKATTAKRGAAAMSSMSTGTTSSKRTARDAAQEACCSAICGTKETLLMAVAVVEQARGALALAEQALEAADSAALMAETTWKFPPP